MPSSHARRTVRIGDIGKVVTGKTPKTSDPANFGFEVPFVTPTDFDGRKWIGRTIRSLSEKGAKAIESSRLPENAVLVTCIGSDMGKVALSKYSCATNQQINSLVVGTDDLPEYVYYNLFLRKAELRQMASGSAQPILNKSAFSAVELDLPSVSVQRYVVDVLSALDNRIDLLAEESFTLQKIAGVIFKSWFIDFDPVRAKAEGREPEGMSADVAALFPSEFVDSELGPIPKGWRIGPISELCERVESGGTPKRGREEFWGGEIPWLTSGEVRSPIVFDTKECVTALGISNSSAKVWPSGTTVVAMYGATAGEACLLAAPLSANQACCGLLPKVGARSLLFFMTRTDRELLASKSTGSAQQNLNKSIVENHPVIVPSDQIISAYEKVVGVLLDRWAAGEQQVRILASIRDTFLPRLLSGAIKVA